MDAPASSDPSAPTNASEVNVTAALLQPGTTTLPNSSDVELIPVSSDNPRASLVKPAEVPAPIALAPGPEPHVALDLQTPAERASKASTSSDSDKDDKAPAAENADVKAKDSKEDKDGKDPKKKKEEAKPKVGYFQLFRYATALDIILNLIAAIAAAASGVAQPIMSIIFSGMINVFSDLVVCSQISLQAGLDNSSCKTNFEQQIFIYAMYFVALAGGSFVVNFIQNFIFQYTGERQARRLRDSFFRAILRQEIGWFDAHKTGELTTRITSDTQLFQDGISDKLGSFIMFLCTFIGGLAVAFSRGWLLSLVLLSVVPLLAIGAGLLARVLSTLTTRGQEAYAKAGGVAEEVLSAMRTVASFAGEEREVSRFSKKVDDAYQSGVKKANFSGLAMGLTFLCLFCAYSLGFWYGKDLIMNQGYDTGTVLNVFFAILIGAFSLGNTSPSITAFAEAQGAAYKIFETIDRKTLIDPSVETGTKLDSVKGSVRLRDVEFNYPSRPDAPVLRGVSIDVEPGKVVALVGSSGSGKSTVIQLLERFYEADKGVVEVDGVDIKNLNLKWLRSQVIGLVSQEPVLFDDTIAENIRYGREGVTMDEIEAACKGANAYDFIQRLPNKFDTMVGERGTLLSGGQKQRIAIARALVKNPKILLLDEATSALDSASEKIVQDALEKAAKGRTTIVIAHRLSTIRHADKIVVMNKGVVVEVGTHDELMEINGGIYHELVLTQQARSKKDAAALQEAQKEEDPDAINPPGEQRLSSLRKSTTKQSTGANPALSEARESKKKSTKTAEEVLEEKKKSGAVSRIFRMNRPEVGFIALGVLGAAVNGGIMPAFSYIFAQIISLYPQLKDPDQSKVDYAGNQINLWAIGFLIIAAGAATANYLQSMMFGLSGERLTSRLRKISFKAMLRQDIAWFDEEKHSTGALTSKLATEAQLVQGLTGQRVGILTQLSVTVIAGLVIGFVNSWKMTLVILAIIPVLGIASALQVKRMSGFSKKTKEMNEAAAAIATEGVGAIRTVASLTLEKKLADTYYQRMEIPYREGVRKAWSSGAVFAVGQSVTFLGNALALWYGSTLVMSQEIDFQQMMTTFSAVIFMAFSAGQAASFLPDVGKATQAAADIMEIVDREPPIDSESTGGVRPQAGHGKIHVKRVHFSYPARPDVTILNGLDIEIEPGQKIALVGASGGGKSTVIALLERFYSPTAGQLLLDGTDIKTINVKHLRQQFGLVSQEPTLFDCTIAENIEYGRPGATQAEIEEAAKLANIHNFVMGLPEQYQTKVGERGAQLSGGQKQRIAIARALIRNPLVLLLDEATSALDNESEKVVQEALDRASVGRTTIIIAHRLSTIRNCDCIYVLKNGVVVEKGKYDELVANKGVFFELANTQVATHM